MAFQGIANFLVQNAPAESLFANGLYLRLPIAGMSDVLTWTTADTSSYYRRTHSFRLLFILHIRPQYQ